ncbi:MAG: glycosyltransferase family 39 protein [Acidimicrobiia bacterium]
MTTVTAAPLTPRAWTLERASVLRLFGCLLLLTVALRLPAFAVDVFNSDETFLATQAEVIRDDGWQNLYDLAADRKPPLVPYVYAATFTLVGAASLVAVRVVAMLAVALTALLLSIEARRRYGERAGWVAGVLMVLASVSFAPQDGQAANFEVFMLPSMTGAVLLARRGRGGWAGVCVALATLAKQTGAATLLPVLWLLGRDRDRTNVPRALLGFAVPIGVVALLVGPHELFFWAVLGNGSYLSIGEASTFVLMMFALMTAAFLAMNLAILWRLPSAWRERAAVRDDGRSDVDLWLWLASGAISVAVGFRFFGHYYLQLLPPLCLLTAGALVHAGRRVRVATMATAAIVAVSFSALGFFVQPFNRDFEYESASAFVKRHTEPGDPVFVWGTAPEIYWASGTNPATRYLTPSLLGLTHPGRPADERAQDDIVRQVEASDAWDTLFEDLTLHPPRYILDTADAGIRGLEPYPVSLFPRLQRLVDTKYRYVRTIDDIDIYEQVTDQ